MYTQISKKIPRVHLGVFIASFLALFFTEEYTLSESFSSCLLAGSALWEH
jgi:hypothetical protein